MGKDRQAEAQAAQAREMARQYDEQRAKVEAIEYDQDKVLENLKLASEQIPELQGLYEAALLNPSRLEEIATDPKFDAIQQGNLDAIQEMAEQGGFSEEDMAKRRQLQRDASASEQARQKSIVQELMQRGQAGSGTELLARLGSSQATAQRQAEAGDRLAMDSASARRQALAQASQQAAGMQQSQFGRESQKATAADQIAQFNALQRAGAANQNLQARQSLANQAAAQKANYYGNAAQTEQQRFANEMSKATMGSNLIGQAGQARIAGVAPKSNVGGMIGTIAGAGLGAMAGPQGAAAGGAIGGQIGSFFNDGGVAGTGLDVDALLKADTEMLNRRGDSILKEGIQKQAVRDSDIRNYANNDGKTVQDAVAQQPAEKGLSLDPNMLSALAGVIGKSKPNKQQPIQFNPTMQPVTVQNTTDYKFADGGQKVDMDSMRDSLLGEMEAFAHGGVKYNDGGISPELQQASQMLRTKNQPQPVQNPMTPMPNIPAPMPPQGMHSMGLPQGAPMPPQGQMMAEGGVVESNQNSTMNTLNPAGPTDSAMAAQMAPMPQMAPQMPQNAGGDRPPQQQYAMGGMAYEDGGEGTIIPGENFEGDELPDRINSGEMVLNVEQQDRLNDALMELKRLKSKERTDKMLADGDAEVNPMQQESLMSFVRGEINVDDLPSERIVKEPSVGEPTGNMAKLLEMVSKKRRG